MHPEHIPTYRGQWEESENSETSICAVFIMLGYDLTFLNQEIGKYLGGLSEKFSQILIWVRKVTEVRLFKICGFFSLFSLIMFWTFSFMWENSRNYVILHKFDDVRLFLWNILNQFSFTFGSLVSCQTHKCQNI